MSVLSRARRHYDRQRAVAVAGLQAVRRQVREHPEDLQGFAAVLAGYQAISATTASRTLAEEAGRAPFVDPLGFAGRTAVGVPLVVPGRTLLDDLAEQMAAAADVLADDMLDRIDRMVLSEITNAGRDAAGVEIAAEPLWTNYVRVLRPPSCPRCAILAGRIYRDNEGFLRHPECDCEHWPVTSWEEAHDEGLVFSAQDAFNKGQIRGLSQADARAIRDGADISQVVNAAQGMYTTSIFGRDGIKATTAGTTKQSAWRRLNPDRPIRLRPESIYHLADGDREEEIRLLKLYGLIRPDADVPTESGRAGGSGGGGRPPVRPPASQDPEDWDARQAALATDTRGDALEPHEVEFLERFEARGEQVQWIPRDSQMRPTNDFVWTSNGGIVAELKSPKARYATIRRKIEQSVAKAKVAGVVKENFVIDLGPAALTPDLRAELGQYNLGREFTRISRLWVLSAGGAQLDEIDLRA